MEFQTKASTPEGWRLWSEGNLILAELALFSSNFRSMASPLSATASVASW